MKFAHVHQAQAQTIPMVSRAMREWWGYGTTLPEPQGYDFATLLIVKGDVVGFHAFGMTGKRLKSQLTYVAKAHRRKGYGAKLWAETIRWTGVGTVDGYAATKEGARLLRALRRKGVKGRFDLREFPEKAPPVASPLQRFARELMRAGFR